MKTYLTVAILMSFSTLMAGNIMTHWAWHSFPLPEGATMADVPETGTIETGRLVGEMKQASAKPEVRSWMFQNPHGFNLGRLRLTDAAGKVITVEQLANPTRTLDLWKGVQTAEYTFNEHPVKVQTTVHPDIDQVAVRIESDLIGTGELAVELEFPYPVGSVRNELQSPWYGKWDLDDRHRTQVVRTPGRADIVRTLDQTEYSVSWKWSDPLSGFEEMPANHLFRLKGAKGTRLLEFVCAFGLKKPGELAGFEKTKTASVENWQKYWMSGGAIDLSESRAPRSAGRLRFSPFCRRSGQGDGPPYSRKDR